MCSYDKAKYAASVLYAKTTNRYWLQESAILA